MGVCALVGAADFNVVHFMGQDFDYVIAVDGGYRHLEAIGVVPDLVLGDFDSLGYVPAHPHVEQFSSNKDETDIELALIRAHTEGYETLVVYGCLGGRLDLSYAVFQLLAQYAQKGLRVFAVGLDCGVTALYGGKQDSLSFSDKARGGISAFSASGKAASVDEAGLAYALSQATLLDTEPLGVSNEFIGQPARISVGEGTLLVFFALTAWDAITA